MLDNVFQRLSCLNKARRTRETDERSIFAYERTTITMLFEQGCISQQSNRTKSKDKQHVASGFRRSVSNQSIFGDGQTRWRVNVYRVCLSLFRGAE